MATSLAIMPRPVYGLTMAEDLKQPHVRLEMLSQARFLAAARAMIQNIAQRIGFNESHCGQMSLAVDEALCNIINHGYDRRPDGHIWVNIWVIDDDPPGIRIVIDDQARQVEPSSIRSRDLEDIRPGGLGVYIIRQIMDDVSYEKRDGGGMRLTLTKRIPTTSNEEAVDAAGSRRASQGKKGEDDE